MSIKQNVRNYLLPMTPSEISAELKLAVDRGDEVSAGYISEFLNEVLEETAVFGPDPNWDEHDENAEQIVPKFYA